MSELRELSDLSRQELYDLVWATPTHKLAAKHGISDVAIAKRCKRLNVPKPPLGFWAKVAAGTTPPRKPLPPPPDEVFAQAAKQSVGKSLPLPHASDPLHPLAAEFLACFPRCRLDDQKRGSLRKITLPKVEASKSQGVRIAQSFHVILTAVEPLGIAYRKSLSPYGSGFFRRHHDRLFLEIEEVLLDLSGAYCSRPSWERRTLGCKLSGRLKFTLKISDYDRGADQEWLETNKLPLEAILARVVKAIRLHFVTCQQQRIEAAIQSEKWRIESERRHREWLLQEAIRQEEARKQNHAAALATAAQTRSNDLLKAAESWRLHRTVLDFLSACEQRWQSESEHLNAEQQSWLSWAKRSLDSLSPFKSGYPDPVRDGLFDAATVPFGGPYPPTRDFPMPPTLLTLPSPLTRESQPVNVD